MRRLAVLLLLSACTTDRQEDPFSDDAALSRAAIPRGSEWRYWDRGGDLGTAWRGSFDDASWSSGAGPLGYGESYLRTTVGYGPSSSNKFVTTYFRRTFTVTDPARVSGVVGELMYDDGAVIYLNGAEIARASMPSGTVTAGTLSSGHEADNAYRTFDWSAHADRLVAGTNVIAVEVHQAAPSSSDLVFDLSLTLDESAPAVVVSEILRRSFWSFWENGGDLGTSWRTTSGGPGWSGGAGVLGYGETYIETPVGFGGDPANKYITTYFTRSLYVSNPTEVTQMIADVMWDDGFAMYLNGTPIARANLPSGAITAATLASGHEAGNAYQRIDLSSHRDKLVAGRNVIAVEVHQASASSSDLVFDLGLQLLGEVPPPPAGGVDIARGSDWRYWDQSQVPGDSWRFRDFNDATWRVGNGPLGYGESYLRTTIGFGGDGGNKIMTTYFRRWFTVEDPSVESEILGELMYDDGAIVYLNGVEIARASMPAGRTGPDTAAFGHEASNRYEAFDWSAASGALVPGLNLLAVEVHQQSPSSSDLVFDLSLEVRTPAVCGIPACGPAVAPPPQSGLGGLFVGPGATWVGGAGTIGRKVGDGDWCWCQRDPGEQVSAAWGSGDDDVWFVGGGGLVLRYDGSAFTRIDAGTTEDLAGVWGSGPDDVWVVGQHGVVRHFDGAAWSDRSIAPDQRLSVVWGLPPGDDVWIGGTQPAPVPEDPELDGASAVIYRWDAAAASWQLEMKVTMQKGFAEVDDLHGTSATDVWAAGADHPAGAACSISAAWHYDGSAWSRVDMGLLDECRDFGDVEAGAPGAQDGAWIAARAERDDDHGTLRFTGGAWSVDTSPATQGLFRIDHRGARMFATGGSFDGTGFRHKIVRWAGDHWVVDW